MSPDSSAAADRFFRPIFKHASSSGLQVRLRKRLLTNAALVNLQQNEVQRWLELACQPPYFNK